KLGDVMKESAQAALSYVRKNANQLGIYSSVFENTDIHIHVPAGAVPKDGPSAGVTIATSLVSAFTSIPVRRDVAMTGEITLRGNVLAIGGLKEKLLAAKRGIISTVMIPQNNEKNLSEVPDEILKGLVVNPVKSIEEVLKVALVQLPTSVIDPVDETVETTDSESQEVTIIPQTDIPESPRTYDA
ncbi:MAG TPA: endopeptidase La, partial [Deltaproteobacteria bacterium]|nr:endopeptidase La [Deltaproteobacteria bacterium]